MRRSVLVGIALSFAVASVAVAAPPSGVHTYAIRRNGDTIGTHRTELRARGDRLAVRHDIDIRVSIAGFEAYTYRLTSSEFWSGDRLTRLTAFTRKNGSPLRVSARATDRQIEVSGEQSTRAPVDAVPASPAWNVLERRPRVMIDAEDGRALDVRVSAARRETIRAAGAPRACRCYRVTGDLVADLCYAADGLLVRKRLRAPDGSTVEEILQRSR